MKIFPAFPAEDDWNRIYELSSFSKIYELLDDLKEQNQPINDGLEVLDSFELLGWLQHFDHKLSDTARSYIFMMFYYEQGIPDQRGYISPGKNGESIQYLPDFEEKHFLIKGWFDFFSDTTYYKLFTTWDLLGHILNIKYQLGIPEEKVDFSKVTKTLRTKDSSHQQIVYKEIPTIAESTCFKESKLIRNNITHNYLPNVPGTVAHRRTNNKDVRGIVVAYGPNRYINSSEIISNIKENLELLRQALKCLLS